MEKRKHIVIVGGGFAGLQLDKILDKGAKYQITLVDMNNYNFFPPLLYQLATGFMEPSSISYPFRRLLRHRKNTNFRMGALQSVVPAEHKIILSNGELHYDILVIATGAETNFFGNKNVEEKAMPMKTVGDALMLRNLVYTRLERATRTDDKEYRRKLLSFAIAGAGPTGVELSGTFAEMKQNIIKKDYPELSHEDLGDIYLIDGQQTVLAPMSEKAQRYTETVLRKKGVKLKLGVFVKDFVNDEVLLSDGTVVDARNLIWAAGVAAKTFDGIDAPEHLGRGRRMKVDAFNKMEGYEDIYAIGDASIMTTDPAFPQGHPQQAQVAIQQAKNLAENLNREMQDPKPFIYDDKGSMAIIGRNQAVADLPRHIFLKGFPAWFIWVFIHIMSLVNFKNKVRTFYNWVGYYLSKDQSYRMVLRPNEKAKG
ncbi:NADH dehydrogenase [Capnocytophaga haemolytica]|uniref:NADH:ubiquinone reductase (non-electrogenic) n=1 Tax=Capnocytophaga haemolytica TaxID=45243 RepID=A0AAX2GYL8_9FLAO|nr:NAD(P)/FAD-dependent oxidoreductase [Capnocytophaga haemolytica]AMD84992.1 NADH dehydrogenase [Capnocytophaga haemolytica]SFO24274.1 NADH dehydrogenase [Capnocytophaga haemolytica]SNV05913.1 NADH dehydrogenase-like protein yjlD [Capnocytophaga haemolytica]